MKIKLLRDQRVLHKAGEIVEVSPVVYRNLIATKSAVPVEAEKAKPNKRTKTK